MPDTDDKKKKKRKRTRATSTQTGRFFRLTSMTTSIATKMASQRVKQVFQSQESAEQSRDELINQVGKEIAETLGEMKGAVMKVGQIASQMKDVLPQQVVEALEVLQNSSAPMPFSVIRRQFRNELGDDPDKVFKQFDEEPFAAASIGQVHKAETHEGRKVVVKVQYPAVRESIDSDMRHLRRILRLGGLLRVSTETLDGIFQEIKQQLNEELDYNKEAEHLRMFRAFHADQPWIVIPEVIEDLTTEKVLTLSHEPGDPLDSIADNPDYDQALRNQLGIRLFNAIGEQIFKQKVVHCDPHPGNFAFRPDGSVVIYDFGAVKRFPPKDLFTFRRLLDAAYVRDYKAIDDELMALGDRKENGPVVSGSFYKEWVDVLLPTFGDQPYDFGHSRLHIKLAKMARDTPLSYLKSFEPSPQTLLLNRILAGHYWTLMKLGANVAFKEKLYRIMDVLDDPANTA